MVNDTLADALNTIKTCDRVKKSECRVKPSKIVRETLKLLQAHNYIGEFEFEDTGRNSNFHVKLIGKVNAGGVIKPRFAVKKDEWSFWEQRYIPGEGFGTLIVSTPQGLMTNKSAKEKNIGGRLLAYVY
ncbi:30S ribosomal protein S8 [Candidatus Micrarchaeota archaeon CG11_big_fil_rev_8_21_14_0_20_47_5]|nr:MAG: 30S ribosomal protein S8 [Candidatus Micrarchaeota archaeon CG1_02_47_40]PIN84258.1 MAG: 30S ribosomal protein S8 [Candidatus Micrarchaeota archaeon CG11_big_fil_rev_8_21_14_0_20_47_5]